MNLLKRLQCKPFNFPRRCSFARPQYSPHNVKFDVDSVNLPPPIPRPIVKGNQNYGVSPISGFHCSFIWAEKALSALCLIQCVRYQRMLLRFGRTWQFLSVWGSGLSFKMETIIPESTDLWALSNDSANKLYCIGRLFQFSKNGFFNMHNFDTNKAMH